MLLLINLLRKNYINLLKTNKVKDTLININQILFDFDDINDLNNFIVKKALEIVDNGEKGDFVVVTEDKRQVKEYSSHKDNVYKFLIKVDGKLYGVLSIYLKRGYRLKEKDILLMKYFTKEVEYIIGNYIRFNKMFDLYRYDGLTDLYNRDYFSQVLEAFVKKKIPFSMVLFDLDEFKEINDKYGHNAGDKIIRHFAKTIKKSMRHTDLIARYGGDEFIGVFFNTNEKNLHKRIADISKKFEKKPLNINVNNVILDFSYGIANFPNDATEIKELIEIADRKMYAFKNSKKNYSIDL